MRAGEVCPQDGFPVVLFHAHGEAVARDRGVVDENVEAAEFFENLLETGFDLLGVGDIHFHRERGAVSSFDFGDQRSELLLVSRRDGNLCAASASAIAVSRPMPCDAPVTRATLSFRLNIKSRG